jgi:hypothetical protein
MVKMIRELPKIEKSGCYYYRFPVFCLSTPFLPLGAASSAARRRWHPSVLQSRPSLPNFSSLLLSLHLFDHPLRSSTPGSIMSGSGERAVARNPPPLCYQHLTDGCLFDEPTAPPPPLKDLPYPYGLGESGEGGKDVVVEKEWEGLLVPTKLQLLRDNRGNHAIVKVHKEVLPENVARVKSIYCNHSGWCIIGVRACVVADSKAAARAGGVKPVQVLIIQDYMDLHSFKDILPPLSLPQQPPPVPEAACAWTAKCVRFP